MADDLRRFIARRRLDHYGVMDASLVSSSSSPPEATAEDARLRPGIIRPVLIARDGYPAEPIDSPEALKEAAGLEEVPQVFDSFVVSQDLSDEEDDPPNEEGRVKVRFCILSLKEYHRLLAKAEDVEHDILIRLAVRGSSAKRYAIQVHRLKEQQPEAAVARDGPLGPIMNPVLIARDGHPAGPIDSPEALQEAAGLRQVPQVFDSFEVPLTVFEDEEDPPMEGRVNVQYCLVDVGALHRLLERAEDADETVVIRFRGRGGSSQGYALHVKRLKSGESDPEEPEAAAAPTMHPIIITPDEPDSILPSAEAVQRLAGLETTPEVVHSIEAIGLFWWDYVDPADDALPDPVSGKPRVKVQYCIVDEAARDRIKAAAWDLKGRCVRVETAPGKFDVLGAFEILELRTSAHGLGLSRWEYVPGMDARM